MKRIFLVAALLLLEATALAAPVAVERPDAAEEPEPLIKPMPVPVAVSNAAAPMMTTNATSSPAPAPAAAAAVAPSPKPANATAAPAPASPKASSSSPSSFVAYTLSAAQATLAADPAADGLATLILSGVSNTTIPRGSSGVLSGPLHTPTFLATSFPAGSTVEVRGSAAAGGGGDWGSAYLRKATLVATGTADGVAVVSGVVVPASLGDAGAATFGTTKGTLVFNKVSVLVTAPPKKWEGGAKAQKLTASPAPAPGVPVAAAKNATTAAPAPAPASAAAPKNATSTTTPKVSVAAATRPLAAKQAVAKSIPMPREFSN